MTTDRRTHAVARSSRFRLRSILLRQEVILFIILVGGVLLLSSQSDKFLTPRTSSTRDAWRPRSRSSRCP